MPARHPLLVHKYIPLQEALKYPLVLCHPEACGGGRRQIERLLRTVDIQPVVAEHVATRELMLALVSAGYGLGFACEAQIATCQHAEVVRRPLAGTPPLLTTYLLRPDTEPSAQLRRFIERVCPPATLSDPT